MIRCFKCGEPATQLPDGTVRRTCLCYQPILMYTPQIYMSGSTTAYTPLINESEKTMPESRDHHDYARTEHLDGMARRLEEHERTCESCSYFKQHERITRCVEYRNLQQMQAFWKKRVEAQK